MSTDNKNSLKYFITVLGLVGLCSPLYGMEDTFADPNRVVAKLKRKFVADLARKAAWNEENLDLVNWPIEFADCEWLVGASFSLGHIYNNEVSSDNELVASENSDEDSDSSMESPDINESSDEDIKPPKKRRRTTLSVESCKERDRRRYAETRQIKKQIYVAISTEARARYGSLTIAKKVKIACNLLSDLVKQNQEAFNKSQFRKFSCLVKLLNREHENSPIVSARLISDCLTLGDGKNIFHYLTAATGKGTGNSVIRSLEILQKMGLDINKQDVTGETPLHASISTRSFYRARQFVQCGADVTLKNSAGNNCFRHLISVLTGQSINRATYCALSQFLQQIKEKHAGFLKKDNKGETWSKLIGLKFTWGQREALKKHLS